MRNIFGDEIEVKAYTYDWDFPHLTVKRGGKLFAMVLPNGWTGKTKTIQHELAEPVIRNLDGDISFKEARDIMAEFWKHTTHGELVKYVDNQIAKEKARESVTTE